MQETISLFTKKYGLTRSEVIVEKVMVDRVFKTLVESLLKEQLGYAAEKMIIHCTKLYVGQKSFVIVSRRIPKSAIVAVTRELNEHMQVRVDGNL